MRARRLLVPALAIWLLAACAGGPLPSATASLPGSAPGSVSASPSASPTATPAPSLPPGVTAAFQLGFRPSGVAVHGELLWLEDHADTNAVYAVDPSTAETVAVVEVERPCDIASAFGSIWVADLDAGEMLRVDPASAEVVDRASGLSGPCGPVAAGGAVWFAVDNGLARLDPATGSVTTTVLGDGGFPGTGEPLWVRLFGSGQLGPVDLISGEVGALVAPPGGPSEDLSVAAGFGSIWVGNGLQERLYRLDPATGAITAEIAVSWPARLLVTDEGLWITSFATGVVERIDPASNEIVFRARLGGTPNGIAEGFGSVWVVDTSAGLLYRIDPASTAVAE